MLSMLPHLCAITDLFIVYLKLCLWTYYTIYDFHSHIIKGAKHICCKTRRCRSCIRRFWGSHKHWKIPASCPASCPGGPCAPAVATAARCLPDTAWCHSAKDGQDYVCFKKLRVLQRNRVITDTYSFIKNMLTANARVLNGRCCNLTQLSDRTW